MKKIILLTAVSVSLLSCTKMHVASSDYKFKIKTTYTNGDVDTIYHTEINCERAPKIRLSHPQKESSACIELWAGEKLRLHYKLLACDVRRFEVLSVDTIRK